MMGLVVLQMVSLLLLLFAALPQPALAAVALAQQRHGAPPRATERSVAAKGKGVAVALSTKGTTAFRVRLDAGAAPVDSPFVAAPDEPDAPWHAVDDPARGRGVATSFGAVLLSEDGRLTLLDSEGREVTRSLPIASAKEVVFSSGGGSIFGMGAGPTTAPQLARYGNVTPLVTNKYGHGSEALVPHYYSTDGYAALGAAPGPGDGPFFPVTFDASPAQVSWRSSSPGPFELFLMPSRTLELGTMAYYGLIGRPPVPPLWTFGFMASRWGWSDRAYIEETLKRFRSSRLPADAFILDFEFYTNESDYDYGPEGKPYCTDFGYSAKTFPESEAQLDAYRKELHFRMGGIRKPRLCGSENLAFAKSKGWLLPQGEAGGDPTKPGFDNFYAVGRNLNFSDAAVRRWCGDQSAHYLDEGIEFWWNDEGEVDYLDFYWWNMAQVDLHRAKRPGKRFFTLNRAFSPGLSRLGAGFWTGDAGDAWEVLAAQPGYLLNWALAGAPYVGSDIGGFTNNPSMELLVRWYQLSTFTPVMRVHSTLFATPHFPWLWGERGESLMRSALELRYRLIPYHYSFAHLQSEGRRLWNRPMVVAFPEETELAGLTHQWIDGELLVAPIASKASTRDVRLPKGTWYPVHGNDDTAPPPLAAGDPKLAGPADLGEVPMFVRAGTIVPLAPLVQHTDALPGGPLEVRVYAGGGDSTFELVEDDGETTAYERGALRRTTFVWNEEASELSWSCEGSEAPEKGFAQVFLALYEPGGGRTASEPVPFVRRGAVLLQGARRLRGR